MAATVALPKEFRGGGFAGAGMVRTCRNARTLKPRVLLAAAVATG